MFTTTKPCGSGAAGNNFTACVTPGYSTDAGALNFFINKPFFGTSGVSLIASSSARRSMGLLFPQLWQEEPSGTTLLFELRSQSPCQTTVTAFTVTARH